MNIRDRILAPSQELIMVELNKLGWIVESECSNENQGFYVYKRRFTESASAVDEPPRGIRKLFSRLSARYSADEEEQPAPREVDAMIFVTPTAVAFDAGFANYPFSFSLPLKDIVLYKPNMQQIIIEIHDKPDVCFLFNSNHDIISQLTHFIPNQRTAMPQEQFETVMPPRGMPIPAHPEVRKF